MGVSRKIHYTRRQVIAVGGMAILSMVIQENGKPLVLRELKPNLRWRPWLHWRFLHGARIRDAVSPHPNIVYSAEYGYRGLIPYELIEYCPGLTLQKMIVDRNERLKVASLDFLRQACAGLAHMHAHGYIHLDIKPENFIVQDDGQGRAVVKLTDFDLSRPYDAHHDFHRSGTANYMSPEMLKSGTIGPQADVFAFGITAYYCMTGRKPFSGETIEAMRRQQTSVQYHVTEPVRHNPDISPKLNQIILRCLEKDTAKRFPNMNYLMQEFGRV